MRKILRLPPRIAQATESVRTERCCVRCWIGLACLALVITTGCRGASHVAQQGRSSTVAELTKPGGREKSLGRTATVPADDGQASLIADDKPVEKPRRLIPEWLRLGQEKESVPLPATPQSESLAADTLTGPVEEFQ